MDLEGTYEVWLTYTVGEESDTDTVVVTAGPEVIADPGPDQEAVVGEEVTLSGSGTPDGGSFFWFLDRPLGSAAVLSGRDTATPTFTPDVEGRYIPNLIYYFDGADARDQVLIDAEELGL